LASVVRNIGRALKSIAPGTSNRLKRSRQRLRSYYEDLFVAADKAELRCALRKLGIRAGDIVFVHSSFDQMRSVRATPAEIIEILCESVGESGTLAMPTFPMTGTSQEYLEHNRVFDWRRTPSRVGILTEIFRRMPGTERSLHPTHAVAARGALAKWLTEGHEHSETPFDERSPFQKLFQINAFILCIGQFDAMTFRHLGDHLMRDKVPYPIYSHRTMTVRLIAKDGGESRIVTTAHNPDLACDHRIVLIQMAREGILKTARVGRIPLSLVPVQTYIEAYHRYYARGLFHHRRRERQNNGETENCEE
jgi:aminoglycoside 3-N-acetyltransferase